MTEAMRPLPRSRTSSTAFATLSSEVRSTGTVSVPFAVCLALGRSKPMTRYRSFNPLVIALPRKPLDPVIRTMGRLLFVVMFAPGWFEWHFLLRIVAPAWPGIAS